MKGKWKYIIILVVILDLLFLGQYGYYRFIKVPGEKKTYISASAEEIPDTTLVENFNSNSINLNYNEKVPNHTINTVDNSKLLIQENDGFLNYIDILQLKNTENLNIDYFSSFIDIRNSFKNEKINFIFLILGEIAEKKIKELEKMQTKFDIIIGTVTKNELFKNYKLTSCNCGFYIFLDEFNRVRFANTGTEIETLKYILKKEYNK